MTTGSPNASTATEKLFSPFQCWQRARSERGDVDPALEERFRELLAENGLEERHDREQALLAPLLVDLPQMEFRVQAALCQAVADVCWKATQYGETEDGDTAAYIVPKGAIHRLVAAGQNAGWSTALRANAEATA